MSEMLGSKMRTTEAYLYLNIIYFLCGEWKVCCHYPCFYSSHCSSFLVFQNSFLFKELVISCTLRIGLLGTDSFRLPSFENILTYPLLLKHIFTGDRTWIGSSFPWALEKCATFLCPP